jgi:hypothetical protein
VAKRESIGGISSSTAEIFAVLIFKSLISALVFSSILSSAFFNLSLIGGIIFS